MTEAFTQKPSVHRPPHAPATAADVMRPAPATIEPRDHVAAAAYLMKHAGVTALVVVDDDQPEQPVGIITEADIAQAVADGKDVNDVRIRALITTHPTVINPATSIRDAARSMVTGHFRHLPVAGEAGLIGIADITDVCAALPGPPQDDLLPSRHRHTPGTTRTRQDSPNLRTRTAIRLMNTLRPLRGKETRLRIMPLDCPPGMWRSTPRRLTRVFGIDHPWRPEPRASPQPSTHP